jgi:hypothetical protein
MEVVRSEGYQAYLLRVWPVRLNGDVTWRASLQCVSSKERRGFESMDALFAFLCAETEEIGDRVIGREGRELRPSL